MSKINSIKENHIFNRVYSKGRNSVEKNIVVYSARNRRDEKILFGITVRKKLGCAVQRNRAKRLIKEAYRALIREYELTGSQFIVVVARSGAFSPAAKMWDIYSDMKQAFIKLGIISIK